VRDGEPDGRQWYSTTRLEAFSDGVFAIAITLLVLDLALGSGDSAVEQVLHAWPSFLAYAISFLTIGAAWLGHMALTDRLARADGILLRLNLLLLFVVSFLPFPTRLVSESLADVATERVFVTMYGVVAIGIGLLLPRLAVALYCLLGIFLVVPFREVGRLVLGRE
jgi:uncharacterized membrane protein